MSYIDENKIAKIAYKISDYISVLDAEEKNDALYTIILNTVSYVIHNNNNKTNWIARDLFEDVIPEEYMKLFDED